VKSNCSCARFFEQHPTIIEDTEEERLQIFLHTVAHGFCKCLKSASDCPDTQRLASKTWLHLAAAVGSLDLVKILVTQAKLDINAATSLYQFTALSLAVMQTKNDLVGWLCGQANIDVNVKSKAEKHTPLVDAMLSEKFHIVSILTKAPGIDLNATNFRNETPLILAVRMNSARLVRQLLEAGADHSIPTADGSLPVMLSVNSGHLVVREFVNAKVPLNTVNSRGESAVTLAVRNRSVDILDVLIAGGASLRANPALPALVLAADLGHLRTVIYLLDIGEDPDQKNDNSWTALHFACMNGFAIIAEVLLNRGADPNVVTSCHNTPLSLAAFHRHRAISELLLSHGCVVNTFDLDLDTPLHFAAFNRDRDMVQNLLDNGALACVFNRAGATPLFNAVVSCSVEIVKILLPHYTDLELHATSQGFMYEEFTYKIQLRYQVPRSVLWVAASQASLAVTTLLLFAGFNASAEEWIRNCDFPACLLSDDMNNLRQLLMDSAATPLSLLSLCRCAVRRILGPGKQRQVNQLNALPRKVKNYIALREL
ncbi:unnamed protein product, partial [Candidula unifasciata]